MARAARAVPSRAPARNYLYGVATASARSARAVGVSGTGKAPILRWNGATWKQRLQVGRAAQRPGCPPTRNVRAAHATESARPAVSSASVIRESGRHLLILG
jgi:hypothetical protein